VLSAMTRFLFSHHTCIHDFSRIYYARLATIGYILSPSLCDLCRSRGFREIYNASSAQSATLESWGQPSPGGLLQSS
jgi:hypothetical protein